MSPLLDTILKRTMTQFGHITGQNSLAKTNIQGILGKDMSKVKEKEEDQREIG